MKRALRSLGFGAGEARLVFSDNARQLLHAVQRDLYQTPGRWEQP